MRCIALAPAFGLFLSVAAGAQTTPGQGTQVTDQIDAVGEAKKDEIKKQTKKKSRDILVVPIPHSSPTLGSGLTLVAGVFYNPNGSPEPWMTGIGAMKTSNKSWALGAAHKMSLAGDKFRIIGFAGLASVNIDFYGIGTRAGNRDLSISLNEKGFAAAAQGQIRLANHVYAGVRYEFLHLTSSINRDKPLFPDAEIPRAQFKSKLSGLGLIANYDRRDSSMQPHDGELVALVAMFNRPAFGSSYDYEKYTLNGNIYRPIGKNTVVAARLSACQASRGGPFFDLCSFGSSSDLRGYPFGLYLNRAYWAGQVELRQHLFWRIGAVAFAGIGQSAEYVTDFSNGKWLPAAGAGLRFQPSKSTPINLRLDYAFGKDSRALYLSVGEAF